MGTAQLVHYCASIARHVKNNSKREKRARLGAAHVAVLHILWGYVRDPFAEQAVVWVTYDRLTFMLGCSKSHVQVVTRTLVHAGCIKKGKSAKGRGTAYTLIRPEHEIDDVAFNPFDPNDAEIVAAAAVEILRQADRALVEF